jgi:hypothetical protein
MAPGTVPVELPLDVLRLSHGAPGKTVAVHASGAVPDALTRNEVVGAATTPPAGIVSRAPEGVSVRPGLAAMKNVIGTTAVPADVFIVRSV